MTLLYRTLITTAVLFIFGVLIFAFIIHPTIVDIKAFNNRIRIERVALENKYTSRRNIKNIVADLKEITAKMSPLMQKMMVQKGQEVEFISKLESIAKKNNLVQKIQITPLAGSGKKMAQRNNVTITLSGDYINTLKYISDLEQSELYIIIYGIDVGSAKNNSSKTASSGTVKTNLQGYVYFST